jgi:U3 small nucleolar RNA-associated protein 20
LALPVIDWHAALPKGSINPPKAWWTEAIDLFRFIADPTRATVDVSQDLIPYRCNSVLEASRLLTLPQDVHHEIATLLYSVLERATQIDDVKDANDIDILATGHGFHYLVRSGRCQDELRKLWPFLCRASVVYGHSLFFWQALLLLGEREKGALDLSGASRDQLFRALMRCLGSPSHDMRLAALGILEIFATKKENVQNIIAVAMMVEQTPLSLDNARSISMRIRQLAKSYADVRTDDWAGEAIPTFCFGLLHVKFSQIRDDACAALKDICETKEGEGHVLRIAFEWLDNPVDPAADDIPDEQAPIGQLYANPFQCTNLVYLEKIWSRSRTSAASAEERLKSRFQRQHAQIAIITPSSRTLALSLLDTIPQVAEKRSRLLVPVLLRWGLDQPVADLAETEAADADHNGDESRWVRKEQKALLSLFSKFTNPKVLFKSSEVYDALLVLLTNGDVEIQKFALKAILAWKNPAITKYKENLFNLLDDARFREEISVFMDVSEENSLLQDEHRDQLLPVILRLMYGKVISGKRGQEAKRKAVFIALTRFDEDAIRQFLGIAMGPLGGISILEDGHANEPLLSKEVMSARRQLGMLNMLEDMLTTLKTTLTPFTSSIVDPLLYCLIRATRGIHIPATTSSQGEDSQSAQLSLLRTIRQRAFHSLNILFESCPEFGWALYAPVIVKELVNPRLEQFKIETAQSVSGLLRLFAAWSKFPQTAPYLVDYNPGIPIKIINVLEVPSAKDEVKIYVLDNIIRTLISTASESTSSASEKISRDQVQSKVIQPYASSILTCVGDLLRKSPTKDLVESGVNAVAELAPRIVGSAESRSMIEISTFLLKQPTKRVNPQTKLGLLRILHAFIPRCDTKDLDELFDDVFNASCSLFSFFRDTPSRSVLCDVVRDLADHEHSLEEVAKLCHDLNSFSRTRLDEPDFDRRSSAFSLITGDKGTSFSLLQWKPLVYNMLYYIKDNDELSIRVNASLSLRRFIDASVENDDFNTFLSSTLIPGLQNGMREPSELVKVEYIAVLAHLVATHPDWAPISDLHALLGPDDEASFFVNVLHIQGHRRLRALRRLASHASQLQPGNIYHILLPLIEQFIFHKAEDENAHNLAGEAIRTVTALSQWLEWPQFRSLLKRYIGYLTSKEDAQKTIIKLLVGLMDCLNEAGSAKGYVTAGLKNSGSTPSKEASDEDAMEVDKPISMLTKTLPQQEKLTTDVIGNILPPLTDFLHNKDESTVSLRVPIAVAVTKVLLVLPPQEIENRLPSVLLDICHILKSRSQDGRDMSRNTLADIALLTGPQYLGFILKSLRTALQRGYQLHVLSFTLHHILVKMAPDMKPGDLDYCLTEIVDVIMDDTFGVTGQEKDAEEYISKMREVKSSKSYDSMDLIARSATPGHLVELVQPIKSLLLEQLNARMVNKIDELLRRIGLGILQNPTVKDRDILVFCYELIQDTYKTKSGSKESKEEERKNRRYLVNMKGAAKSGARGTTSSYIYKLTRFSLDILRTVLRNHEELQTPQNLAGFLPIWGDALVQGQEEVQISAVRLVTTIIRVPMSALDRDCPVYVSHAVQAIKNSSSTNNELAQASLKLVSAIIRERPNVEIKERDLAQLLKRLLPDLDEPDRQGVTFGFLRAIMNRKIVITEVYEVMDKVAAMMVTNQTRSARDLARSTYFYFLMEYPQAKNRFTKQLEFLVRNLRYDYVEGRQSVMEALNLILTKVGDDVLQDVLVMMFIPLIHSMANDDSSDCRTMAGALVSKLFERADSQRLKSFTTDLRGWLEQNEDTGLKRLGIQCWGLYMEATEAKPKEMAFVLDQLQSTVEQCLVRRDEDDWELIYYSLTVFSKLCKASPDSTLSSAREDFWNAIWACVSYPHAWVKLTAAKLIGIFFADIARTNGDGGLDALPLEGSKGLRLTEENMIQLTNTFIKNLSMPNVTEDLCAQSVRNLAFLARCLAVNGAIWNWQKVDDDDEVEGTANEQQGAANGEDASSDEEEWGGLSPPPKPAPRKDGSSPPTAIHRLIKRLSGIIRRETKIMRLPALYPKTATMTLLETLSVKLPVQSLTSALPHLLTTLSTMVDPATTIPRSTDPSFNEQYKGLIDKAREVMTILQKQLGTPEYLAVMQEVQKGVKQRREDRRTKRKVEAITMPERHHQEKRRRHEVSKLKRKQKSADEKGRRRGW